MYKVVWNNGKAQQLFITYPEAKRYKHKLEEDGEDKVYIQEEVHARDSDCIVGKRNR
jgi:hypothetical protein